MNKSVRPVRMAKEEQFALDSMALVSDEELIEMGHWNFEYILWFIECNHREKIMERMDPSAKKIFEKRRIRRELKEEEERRIEAEAATEMERQRLEEIERQRKEQKESRQHESSHFLNFLFGWFIHTENAV